MEDENRLLRGRLNAEYPEKRKDLVKVRFEPFEFWTPPNQPHPVPRVKRGTPSGYIAGMTYEVPKCDATPSHPWFMRV